MKNLKFKYVGPVDQKYTPKHATSGASGCDLRAVGYAPIVILPLCSKTIPTGICVEIPEGFEGQVRPRSGLSVVNRIVQLPTVGTIDSDYRGVVSVTLLNLGQGAITIEPGERIAQLVVAPYEKIEWTEESKLSETDRGTGGFGSTGK